MIRPRCVVAVEYRRVVVELLPAEYAALDAACGPFVSPAQYVRLVALRLASGLSEQHRNEPVYFSHLDRRRVQGSSAGSTMMRQ
jgi:hypothetical protein